MSEPQIIPLWPILRDVEKLRVLHAVQLRRAREVAFTDGDRPLGARLSISDPVRRVKAIFDSWWRSPVADGVGERGYLMEDLLEVGVIRELGGAFTTQVPISWGPEGEGWQSAFDFVLNPHAEARVVSCKSSATDSIAKLKPSKDNIGQERRMLALAGYPAGTEFDVWMTHPGSLDARGPFTFTLEQEHIDAALTEQESVVRAWSFFRQFDEPWNHPAWNDPDAWESMFGLVTTSGAFKFERLDACGAIEKRNRPYLARRRERLEAEQKEKVAKELLFPFIREQIELARQTDPNAKSVIAYSGDLKVTYTMRKDGAIIVTESPLEAEGASPAGAAA